MNLLTYADEVGALSLHQAVSSCDDPVFTENGAAAEQLTSGTKYQGHLERTGWGRDGMCETLQENLNSPASVHTVPARGSLLG